MWTTLGAVALEGTLLVLKKVAERKVGTGSPTKARTTHHGVDPEREPSRVDELEERVVREIQHVARKRDDGEGRMSVREQLLRIEEALWTGGAPAYEEHVTENALFVFTDPIGAMSKPSRP